MQNRTRERPRISINKLGEYLTASASRRRRIIHDQKHPPAFQVARYTVAERAMVESLLASGDISPLEEAVERLSLTTPTSEYDEERIASCIDALEKFCEIDIDLEGLAVVRSEEERTLNVQGVDVSVRPNVMLHGPRGRFGLIKLYISKGFPLDKKAGDYVASVCSWYASHCEQEAQLDPRLVRVIDVFGRQVFTAPKALKRRMSDVEAACEEICSRWDLL